MGVPETTRWRPYEPEGYGVPAAPNESVIRGEVLRVRPTAEGIGGAFFLKGQDVRRSEG